jgi:hypothetical protein
MSENETVNEKVIICDNHGLPKVFEIQDGRLDYNLI